MPTSTQQNRVHVLLAVAGIYALAAALLPAYVLGQVSSVPQPQGEQVRAVTGSYVLGTGDTLAIDVADMPEVTTKAVKIDADGQIDLGLLGSVQAAGLSVQQLRAALVTRVSKYVTQPVVTINVVGNVSRFVSVVGEVNAPGLHPLDGPRNLIEVISEAGGVKTDAGPRIIVTRNAAKGALPTVPDTQRTADGTRLTMSLNELMSSAAPASNIALLPGDTVSIPKEQLVYVVGDVHRAGGFPMSSQETVSILQALSLAEGANSNASLKAAKILRPVKGSDTPKELPINLDAILAGKAPNQPLYANDVLFVPKSAAKSGTKRAAEIMVQIATGIAIYR